MPLELERLYPIREVEEVTSLNPSTIYRRIRAGTFPPPVRTGPKGVAWRASDLRAWQAALAVGVRTDESPNPIVRARRKG